MPDELSEFLIEQDKQGSHTYSSLSLNFLSATATSATVMAKRMKNSRSTAPKATPSIISMRMASMYHRAGMIHESTRSTPGIFATGKIMFESMITGIRSSIPQMRIATTCVRAKVEINNPKASAKAM